MMPSFYTNIVVTYLTPLHDYDDDNEMLNRCRQLSRRSFEVPAEENPPRDLELQFTPPCTTSRVSLLEFPGLKWFNSMKSKNTAADQATL